MTFISVPIGDAKEAEAVAEGKYLLRVKDAKLTESKKGNPMVALQFVLPEEPNASIVFDNLMIPNNATEEKARAIQVLRIAQFVTAFGIPYEANGFDPADAIGAEAEVYLKQEVDDSGTARNKPQYPRLNKS